MDTGLQGRVVMITGAGGGIGRTMALSFSREGAKVAVNDISEKGVAETVDMIRAAGGTAEPARCDITDLSAVRACVRTVEEALGGIDALVNNAALIVAHELFVETKPEDCDKEIKVVLYGTMNCTRAVLPGMIERRFGKIVNIVTDAARVGQERQANYSAAKGGVISFTKSLAKEVGPHNINVNAVSPGATNSPIRAEMLRQLTTKIGEEKAKEREEKVRRLYPLRRIGESEDVSNAVVFLASDLARHVTGQIVSVNGGFAMPG